MNLTLNPSRAVKIGIVATGAAVVLTGTAYAFWTSTGSGSGTSTSATAKALVLTAPTASPVPAPSLYPGGPKVDVNMLISNPNPYPVALTSITSAQVTGTTSGSCPVANGVVPTGLATATPAAVNTPIPAPAATIAAGVSASPFVIPTFLTMATAAPDACQNVGFTVHVDVTGTQQ